MLPKINPKRRTFISIKVTRYLDLDDFFFSINIMAKQKSPEQLKRIELSHKLTKLRLERNLNPEDIEYSNLALKYGSRI